MMFKEKSSKKRIHVVDNKKEISTLDALHSKAIENFNTIDEDIRKTESNLHIINQQYESNLQEISISNDVSNINQICISNISLKNQIIQLKSTLEKLNDNDEIDYYEKTGAIMFDYYNMIEEQSSHSTKKSNINLKKNKILKDLFCGTEVEEEKVEQPSIDKTTLINEYLSLTNNQYTFHSDGVVVDDVCEICGEEIIPLLTDA